MNRNKPNTARNPHSIKARIFLFDKSVTSFADCVHFDHPDERVGENKERDLPEKHRKLQLSSKVNEPGFEVETWVLEKIEVPDWFSFISNYVDASDPAQQEKTTKIIYGMLVLVKLKRENRIFGVSFSYGHKFVRYEKLESGFGRQIALNTISRDGLRTLDVHNIDLVTRKKRIHVNREGDTSDFRLDGEDVIVTGVIGIPANEHQLGQGQIEGTDSLSVSLKEPIQAIERKCRQLLNLFYSDNFTRTFPELTRLLPISGMSRQTLDERLFTALSNRALENISLMLPNLDHAFGTSQFAIYEEKRFISNIEELELKIFYDAIGSSNAYNWAALKIGIRRDGEAQPSTWFHLLEGLIYLYEEDNAAYLYSFGYWYGITQDYQERLTRKISEIEGFDHLPPMSAGQSEGDYNAGVAHQRGYCLLDKKLIVLDKRNRIEVADFVTPNWEFVCVKKASSSGNEVHSATLSHLFAQGSVSAILLSNDSIYRDKIALHIKNSNSEWSVPFNANGIKEQTITFVYAIITNSQTSLADRLPLFSKITLLNHVEEIRKLGYQVKLCRIEQI